MRRTTPLVGWSGESSTSDGREAERRGGGGEGGTGIVVCFGSIFGLLGFVLWKEKIESLRAWELVQERGRRSLWREGFCGMMASSLTLLLQWRDRTHPVVIEARREEGGGRREEGWRDGGADIWVAEKALVVVVWDLRENKIYTVILLYHDSRPLIG
jgi:hypothetical protein